MTYLVEETQFEIAQWTSSGWGKVGSKENYDRVEQKLSDIISELSNMVCLIWLKYPRFNLVSWIEASK